jgi:phosphoribosylformimino-5-aminoimidazole carboxamide ribotide isomerase
VFVIPAIDLKDGKCVRLKQGKADEVTVYSHDPVKQALEWEEGGASLIHVVDLDGAFTGTPKNLDWVSRICEAVTCEVELGGGLRSRDTIQAALDTGVDRVVVGTKALAEPFLKEILHEFQDKIVVGIDARDGMVAIQGWTEKSDTDALKFAKSVGLLGAKRIIFTDVQTDGMLTGPPLSSIKQLCERFPGGVIASGGVGSLEDVRALQELHQSNLEGVIVGKALYEKKFSLTEVS